jgi:uracil-DNA glycosylase
MIEIKPQIEESWKVFLEKEFKSEYFKEIKDFLVSERKSENLIYPSGPNIFKAFDLTPLAKLKAVILGQDPYHGPGQAHGLSFSVPEGIPIPPSLRNIFKELKADLSIEKPISGNLEKWANQGVLLLNATLTVRANEAGSHQNRGWEKFTDAIISSISREKEGIVFMLWGKYAQAKESLIDSNKHLILMAAHPSPFAADRGFFGCKHFSKANDYLKKKGKNEIDWSLH